MCGSSYDRCQCESERQPVDNIPCHNRSLEASGADSQVCMAVPTTDVSTNRKIPTGGVMYLKVIL